MRPGLKGHEKQQWMDAMSRALEHRPREVLIHASPKDLKRIGIPETDDQHSLTVELAIQRIDRMARGVRPIRFNTRALQKKTDKLPELVG